MYTNGSIIHTTVLTVAQRLGLRRQDPSDESKIFKPLLDTMEEHKMDFHGTFRKLCFFNPEKPDTHDAFIESLLTLAPDAAKLDRSGALKDWKSWLGVYSARVQSENVEWAENDNREVEMKKANPRFILRQWLLEEVIARVEEDPENGKRVLAKVLHVSFCFSCRTACYA